MAQGKPREGGITLFSPLEEELQRSFVERAREDLGEAAFQAVYSRGVQEAGEIVLDVISTRTDPAVVPPADPRSVHGVPRT